MSAHFSQDLASNDLKARRNLQKCSSTVFGLLFYFWKKCGKLIIVASASMYPHIVTESLCLCLGGSAFSGRKPAGKWVKRVSLSDSRIYSLIKNLSLFPYYCRWFLLKTSCTYLHENSFYHCICVCMRLCDLCLHARVLGSYIWVGSSLLAGHQDYSILPELTCLSIYQLRFALG